MSVNTTIPVGDAVASLTKKPSGVRGVEMPVARFTSISVESSITYPSSWLTTAIIAFSPAHDAKSPLGRTFTGFEPSALAT